MKIENLSIDDIKRGYIFNADLNCYSCIKCTKTYEVGEIYKIGNRFFEASKAIELHMELEHSDYLEQLLNSDSKYNTLTENQKQLFQLFISDLPDKEIAKQIGVSTSTIRHQKFIFREKAKQAKLYLALYESVFEDKSNKSSTIIPIHEHARMVDERYVVTEEERKHILDTSFESMNPLKLKVFSSKEKKKVVILSKILEQFERGKKYSEKEVNQILESIYDDFATIRRYLIEYGFMSRNKECTKYWLT
ncbi:DUF2087 domain-containing protein [Clostridioides difficile]|uniref:DUF2087 domain-containing protein n=2 Tax=Clostridioides difficile TaxID=1496 RepID=A0A9P3U2B3_CLODI|nr:DUF2087 domain-containing protein [Clostridioides difficile]AWH78658.1 DUF2087 domain-containing protein [Clostridioides difficile]AWH82483.1 DUF2087 domain-containing protein [Clostridioides difficile]AXU47575.1 transcriptional regulator [Clostridioides difficile]AXU51228.1 transcriptional regulator [Clostridioides difficile]AXU65702.1 transcriptional regulator [Clostridioides difficile]